MKKLVLGLAVCGYVAVSGMESETQEMSRIKELVSNVAVSPEDSEDLRTLIGILSDPRDGQKNSEMAILCFDDLQSVDNVINFEQVFSMLQTVLRDWTDYGYPMSVDYYIKGAFSGKFGPYSIPDEVDCY